MSRRVSQLRERVRRHRIRRAQRAHTVRLNGGAAPSVPGSEHTHLLQPRSF